MLGRDPLDDSAPYSPITSPKASKFVHSEEEMSLASLLAKLEAIERKQYAILQNVDLMHSNIASSGCESPLCLGSSRSPSPGRLSISSVLSRGSSQRGSIIFFHGGQVTVRNRLWRFLEDRASSTLARWYSHLMAVLIFVGVLNFWSAFFNWFTFCPHLAMFEQMFFAIELAIRFLVCPDRSDFLVDLYNWADLTTTLMPIPVILASFGHHGLAWLNPEYLAVFCPIFMMLKLVRRFQALHLLMTAIRGASNALPLLMYTLFVIGSFFTAVIYTVEPRSNIASLGGASWLVVVTMSTVGYGDVTATTMGGYIASFVMIIVGMLYMALPIGMIGKSFSTVWSDRHRLMTLESIRNNIRWAGLSVSDVFALMESVGEDDDGRLTFDDFKELLPLLDVDVSEVAAIRLFKSVDVKEEGCIEYNTFLDAVFPGKQILTRFYRARLKRMSRKARQAVGHARSSRKHFGFGRSP